MTSFCFKKGCDLEKDMKNKEEEMNQMQYNPTEQPAVSRRNFLWTFLAWMLLIYVVSTWFYPKLPEQLTYTKFKTYVQNNRIVSIQMKGDSATGQYLPGEEAKKGSGEGAEKTDTDNTLPFATYLPALRDTELLPLLEKKQITIKAVPDKTPWFFTALITLLPWLLIIGFFIYSRKQFQKRMGDTANPFSFGKSKATQFDKFDTHKTFKDVAGLENAKREMQEIATYLKNPSQFKTLGATLPKGLLLIGPPGVGKTLMAQATAGEADVPFYSISGSEFIEMFVGVGASRVRDMFKKAKKQPASIIFIDEIDSIGRLRGTGLGGGHDEREQTLNQILSEMDGFKPNDSLIVIAATNRPDVLDPALVRPGRFYRRITLDLPQKKARQAILEAHTRHITLDDLVDLDRLSEKTVGMSGAD